MRLEYDKFSILLTFCLSMLGLIVSYSCYGWGVYRLWQGAITYGTMTLFLQISGSLTSSFSALASLAPTAVSLATSAGRIMEVTCFDEETDADSVRAKEVLADSENGGVTVVFDNVTFTYRDSESPVLRGVSFEASPGSTIGLIGPSGEGKTTMLKIVMGIDSPDAGQVQYAKDCQVGYLEQETNLEHKDTTILAEVMAAAKEIRRMGERANELQAQITELSEQGKDVVALLNEYGQVQDRFEHLGGYELESNAR